MADPGAERWDETATVEVRVFRNGELVRTELCESEEQAALAVEPWTDVEGVRCEVGDVSDHRAGEGFEPDPVELSVEDDYRVDIERSVDVTRDF